MRASLSNDNALPLPIRHSLAGPHHRRQFGALDSDGARNSPGIHRLGIHCGIAGAARMTMTSRRVVCATRRTVFAAAYREIVQRAGFTRALVTVPPTLLFDAVKDSPGCLVIIDGNSAPYWHSLAAAQQIAPGSHFVLCSKRVTPLLVREAFECGLHGVLSSRLAVDDAAQALVQISRGERQFRFDPPENRFESPHRAEPARDRAAAQLPENRVASPRRAEPARETAGAPPPGPADFDALWMFECRPGV